MFDRWAQVAPRLRAGRRLAVFLDFDGTLAPIRFLPGQVRLSPGTRKVLVRLARCPRLKVWIVSGRRRRDLRRRVGVRGVRYLGLYGWEEDANFAASKLAPTPVRAAKRLLSDSLAGLRGVWMEDKGKCFAIHYRGAARNVVRRARTRLDGSLQAVGSTLQILSGKKVWEVLPCAFRGKGKALNRLLADEPRGTLAIYVGDDNADEDAFRILRRAITVRVGAKQQTYAKFRLRDPQEVREFLERLGEAR